MHEPGHVVAIVLWRSRAAERNASTLFREQMIEKLKIENQKPIIEKAKFLAIIEFASVWLFWFPTTEVVNRIL